MTTSEHRRRYRRGHGVTVEFTFRPGEVRKGEVSMSALACEWDPAIPRFPPGNARNKFLRRYQAARDDFMQDGAQLIGGPISTSTWTSTAAWRADRLPAAGEALMRTAAVSGTTQGD
jgi:hypothetical protein